MAGETPLNAYYSDESPSIEANIAFIAAKADPDFVEKELLALNTALHTLVLAVLEIQNTANFSRELIRKKFGE